MVYAEKMVQSADGLELYLRVWKPASGTRAVVVMTHGHGEHIGRYDHVGQALAADGICCVGYDLRGHGRSGGQKGFVRTWDDFRQDLGIVFERAQSEAPQTPVFVYGHSVGGAVCLEYAMRRPEGVKGVIASAPTLGRPNIPSYLFTMSKILSRIYPRFSLATQLDQTSLSREPEVVRAYQEDPLVHNRGTARLGTELAATSEWIQSNAAMLQLPLLLIHGEKDRLVNPADSRRFFDNVGAKDKTLMVIHEGFHEPHNDLEKNKVIETIKDWITTRL